MTCSYCGKPDDAHYPTCPLRPGAPRPSTAPAGADTTEIETNVPAVFQKGRIEVLFSHEGRSFRVLAPAGYVAQRIVKELRLPKKFA